MINFGFGFFFCFSVSLVAAATLYYVNFSPDVYDFTIFTMSIETFAFVFDILLHTKIW